jgi:hypothetical protein
MFSRKPPRKSCWPDSNGRHIGPRHTRLIWLKAMLGVDQVLSIEWLRFADKAIDTSTLCGG